MMTMLVTRPLLLVVDHGNDNENDRLTMTLKILITTMTKKREKPCRQTDRFNTDLYCQTKNWSKSRRYQLSVLVYDTMSIWYDLQINFKNIV